MGVFSTLFSLILNGSIEGNKVKYFSHAGSDPVTIEMFDFRGRKVVVMCVTRLRV